MNDSTDRDDDRKMPARANVNEERDNDDDDAASVASSQSSSMSVEGRTLPTTPMDVPPTATSSSSKRKQTSSSVARKKKVASSKKAKAKREDRELRPAPYFYYLDHSREVDADPLTPLATTVSVPNFVTKLHAILICDSLGDVIGWMPHGRSWKILKEVRCIYRIYVDRHIFAANPCLIHASSLTLRY